MRSLMFAVAGVLGLAGAAQAVSPPDPDFSILGGSFGVQVFDALTGWTTEAVGG